MSATNEGAIGDLEHKDPQSATLANSTVEKIRAIANWDPCYPEEQIDWQGEYVARYGPLSISWLEPAAAHGGSRFRLESRGLGLYTAGGQKNVISPLDDGTICIWDVGQDSTSTRERGSIIATSKPGLVSFQGNCDQQNMPKAQMTSTGVMECVRVDSSRDKVYVAVQSGLHEVDLNTLRVSAFENYPFSISALSSADDNLPLTVGTTLSLHIYDHRQSNNHRSGESDASQVDVVANFPISPRQRNDFSRLLSGDDEPCEYAPLFQPGPLSVHHLAPQGKNDPSLGEIYVAGRFPSVLVYDRRTFPRLRTNFHSGARLCSLTSLPFSFRSLESDLMRKRHLSLSAVEEVKNLPGDRLIACGEYNGKGSLEIFVSHEPKSMLFSIVRRSV